MATFKDGIINLSPIVDKNENFFEAEIILDGHNFLWLDVAAVEELKLFVAIEDIKTHTTYTLINHTVIPHGAFLSLFNNKLISNKKIIIRSTKKALAYYESKSAD